MGFNATAGHLGDWVSVAMAKQLDGAAADSQHQPSSFLGAIMNYDNPDLDSAPAIDWSESQAEAAACQQIEYDQQQAEALPF